MTENPAPTQDPALPFRAILTPHRSLPAQGFVVLMAILATVSFVTGVVFLSIGAWPVLGFLGLDVLIVYVAFRLNYRDGRLYEVIELDRQRVAMTRVHPSGRREMFSADTYWTRVLLEEERDGRTVLRMGSRGAFVTFGHFLTDNERREFADVLRSALTAARGGPRI